MLKERQHFNSFKAMYNSLYTSNFTLITRRVALAATFTILTYTQVQKYGLARNNIIFQLIVNSKNNILR